MTLSARIDLVNALIAEDGDRTIRDYLDTVAEIEAIKPPEIKEPVMNTPLLYTSADANYIIINAHDPTVRQIAGRLNLSIATVYNFGSRYGLTFKKPALQQKRQFKDGIIPDAPKEKIQRAPGIYNNIQRNYLP